MTSLDTSIAELSRGAFNEAQRRVLRAAFTSLRDAFKDVLLLKGVRRSFTAAFVANEMTLDCPFKPQSVLILNVTQGTASFANLPVQWSWSATSTGGTVTFYDFAGLIPATPTPTWDVFLEKE